MVLLYSMGSGGAERVTANLSNYWVAQGNEVTIATIASQNFNSYDLDPRIERIYLDLQSDSKNVLMGLYHNAIRVVSVRRLIKQLQPDIAIAMMTTSNVILALATLGMTNIKTIGSERSNPSVNRVGRLWTLLMKYTYRLLSAVTAMSTQSQEWLQVNTNAKSVIAIPNFASWPLPSYEPKVMPPKSQRKILLAVGRLVNEKGQAMLIDAFSKVEKKYPDWDLFIVGEGYLENSLKKQVNQLDLDERIFFPGKVGNVCDWYESSDLYVMSSVVEGFPNTLVEAMSYGLPSVSFDCDTGPRDIITHEVNGLLVKPKDIDGLAEALDRMMGDDELRKQFAIKAPEVRDKFSLEKITGMWETLFQN